MEFQFTVVADRGSEAQPLPSVKRGAQRTGRGWFGGAGVALKENQPRTLAFSRLTQNTERKYGKEIIFSQKFSHSPAPFNSQEKCHTQRLWRGQTWTLRPIHYSRSPVRLRATSFSSWMDRLHYFPRAHWSFTPCAAWFQALPLHCLFPSCAFPAGWWGGGQFFES